MRSSWGKLEKQLTEIHLLTSAVMLPLGFFIEYHRYPITKTTGINDTT